MLVMVFDDVIKQEDQELMEDMGVNSYRFSISWARILPSECVLLFVVITRKIWLYQLLICITY